MNYLDANCKDSLFGTGRVGDLSTVGCKEGEEGSKTAVCLDTGKWELQEDACVLVTIKELFIDSEVGHINVIPYLLRHRKYLTQIFS